MGLAQARPNNVTSLYFLIFHCSGEKIFPAAWEVIEALELFEIPVVSLVSDGAKPNRRLYNLCQVDQQAADGVSYKTTNPLRQDSELYFFCDAPHYS